MAHIPIEWIREYLEDWFGPTRQEPFLSPEGIQDRTMAEIDPAEILYRMTQQLNAAPISYSTDPETGRTIATRSIPKTPMPEGMPGRYYPYFAPPESGIRYFPEEPEQDLRISALLQPGWEKLPYFRNLNPPASAEQRAALAEAGISSEGRPRFSFLNPAKDVSSLLRTPTYTDVEGARVPATPAYYSATTGGWTTKRRPVGRASRYKQTPGFIPRSSYLK